MELEPSITAKLCCLSLGRTKDLVYPGYTGYNARPRAFATWPKSMPQTKEHLADADFRRNSLQDWQTQNDLCKEQTKL